MYKTLILILKIKFKILFRNNFGKTKKHKSWVVLILQFLFLLFLAFLFKTIFVTSLLLVFLFNSILNFHSIDDKSWLDSNVLYPIYPKNRFNIKINLMSDLIMKLVFSIPFLLFFSYNASVKELALGLICILLNIVLSFLVSELSFKDIKFKKAGKVMLISYIVLFVFATSGALDFENLAIKNDTLFLSFLKKYSFNALLVLGAVHFLMSLILVSLYLKKYHYQVASYEH